MTSTPQYYRNNRTLMNSCPSLAKVKETVLTNVAANLDITTDL